MLYPDKYRDIIGQHIEKYSSLQCQDIVKLCFQGCFGPGHLLIDPEKAYKVFMQEFEVTPAREGMICEPISECYCRINIAEYKHANLPAEWLFQMFYQTAIQAVAISKEELREAFSMVTEIAKEGKTSFSAEEWEAYVTEYLSGEIQPVHHSEEYRKDQEPHYRVVLEKYEKILCILKKMAEQQQKGKKSMTIEYEPDEMGELVAVPVERVSNEINILAIEGRAASGKSTLAKDIAAIVGAPIIAMDHFFLPKSLQKPKRLREIGGNIHYERFIEEVLPNIKERRPFSYAIYDCSISAPNGVNEVPIATWRIVEGVYSLHPKFGDYADIKIFVDVGPEEQMQRIRARNGLEMAKMFREHWIPMEETYFHACKHEKNADCIYNGFISPY